MAKGYTRAAEEPRRKMMDDEETPQMFGGSEEEGTDEAESEDEGGLDDDEVQALIRGELQDAEDYVENTLGERRAEATLRYKGEPYGNEEPGRSQIVSRDLRDTVMQILPSLMRIFCGPKQTVCFEADRPDAEQIAKQRTDYVNLVFTRDNPGFDILYGWFKDSLIRSYGVVKWWWEDKQEVEHETYEGLLQEQVAELGDDDTITDMAVEEDGEVEVPVDEDEIQPDQMIPGGQAPAQPPAGPRMAKTYRVRIRREFPKNRAMVKLIPGEEFLIDRNATCIEDATIVAHRSGATRSDLIAMGYDPDFIDDHSEAGDFTFEYAPEALARKADRRIAHLTAFNPSLAQTQYTEVWVRFDQDGDGIAELHKVCCLGENYFVARVEDADEIPFAIICPDPEPHEFAGQGYFDILEDIQRINTDVLRASLDSLSLAIIPRLEAVEGQVNMADVLNTEIGAVIRSKAPGMVNAVQQPFVGDAGLRMLEFFQGIKEERGGVTRASQGLDADSMQSTTKAAVAGQLAAAQARIELLARIFAETGVKRLFAGLQRLIMRHQDVARTVRLRKEWVTVDPRTWNAELDVRVNVGLGQGAPEDRLGRLQAIAEKQEAIMQQIGPSSPLVKPSQYRATLAKMVELSGEGDPDEFFGDVPADWAPEPPAPPPDPAMVVAQAQAKKLELDGQIAQQKLMLEKMKLEEDLAAARLKARADLEIEILKIEAQYKVDLNDSEIFARVEADKNAQNAAAKVAAAQIAAQNAPAPAAGAQQ